MTEILLVLRCWQLWLRKHFSRSKTFPPSWHARWQNTSRPAPQNSCRTSRLVWRNSCLRRSTFWRKSCRRRLTQRRLGFWSRRWRCVGRAKLSFLWLGRPVASKPLSVYRRRRRLRRHQPGKSKVKNWKKNCFWCCFLESISFQTNNNLLFSDVLSHFCLRLKNYFTSKYTNSDIKSNDFWLNFNVNNLTWRRKVIITACTMIFMKATYSILKAV